MTLLWFSSRMSFQSLMYLEDDWILRVLYSSVDLSWVPWVNQLSSTTTFYHTLSALEPDNHGLTLWAKLHVLGILSHKRMLLKQTPNTLLLYVSFWLFSTSFFCDIPPSTYIYCHPWDMSHFYPELSRVLPLICLSIQVQQIA